MMSSRVCVAAILAMCGVAALPAQDGFSKEVLSKETFSKDANMVEHLRAECSATNDGLACIKFKVLNLIDQATKKDNVKVSDNVSVVRNGEEVPSEGRGLVDQLAAYVQTHDMLVALPSAMGGSTLAISPRNIDNNELSLSLRYPNAVGHERGRKSKLRKLIIPLEVFVLLKAMTPNQLMLVARRGRKSKLRKLIIPLVVFVLLKAMTLIPLAIGVLGLKAWNALQLSFFSFVISVALAVFQLCKKIAQDSAVPAIATSHPPWDAYAQYAAARNFFVQPVAEELPQQEVQDMAYGAYSQ